MDLIEITDNTNRHPWELNRVRVMSSVFSEYVSVRYPLTIADIGSGDCFFIEALSKELSVKNIEHQVYAVDKEYRQNFITKDKVTILNNIELLEDESLDVVFMMDLLEHVEDDMDFVHTVYRKLKVDGVLIVTVPAYQFLFSSHDVYLKHFRRYDYPTLYKLLSGNGFSVVKSHYFYFSLWLTRIIQKIIWSVRQQKIFGASHWSFSENHVVTQFIVFVLSLDYTLCCLANKFNIRLFGLSLLAVAKKHP